MEAERERLVHLQELEVQKKAAEELKCFLVVEEEAWQVWGSQTGCS